MRQTKLAILSAFERISISYRIVARNCLYISDILLKVANVLVSGLQLLSTQYCHGNSQLKTVTSKCHGFINSVSFGRTVPWFEVRVSVTAVLRDAVCQTYSVASRYQLMEYRNETVRPIHRLKRDSLWHLKPTYCACDIRFRQNCRMAYITAVNIFV